jgi:flagellin
METQMGIGSVLDSLRATNDKYETLLSRIATGRRINQSKDSPSEWGDAQRARGEYGRLLVFKQTLNEIAGSTQIANDAMTAIGDLTNNMKKALEGIFNGQPSLSMGSQERNDMIDQYNSAVRDIDSYALPADEGAKRILSDTVNGSNDWLVQVAPGTTVRLHKEEVHTGATGLNLPTLTAASTDAEIKDALDRATQAYTDVTSKQRMLAGDAKAIESSIALNDKFMNINVSFAQKTEASDMTEDAALMKAMELRNQMTLNALSSIGGVDSKMLLLFG